jgi:hypothetical protein
MTPDPITAAALAQLAAHHDLITELDGREAGHHAMVTGRLTELTDLTASIVQTLQDHQTALARFENPDETLTGTAGHPAGITPPGGPDLYRPGSPPAWWKLAGDQRREAAGQLRAWVDQVYRPGYGHLAGTLGPCWASHDLCLYGLDILSTLWSVLYLQPSRSPGLVSAQAEYQARILPALADQLHVETSRCGHPRTPGPARHPRSMP